MQVQAATRMLTTCCLKWILLCSYRTFVRNFCSVDITTHGKDSDIAQFCNNSLSLEEFDLFSSQPGSLSA